MTPFIEFILDQIRQSPTPEILFPVLPRVSHPDEVIDPLCSLWIAAILTRLGYPCAINAQGHLLVVTTVKADA